MCKDCVLTSFRNQNYWMEIVRPPKLPAHSQASPTYYRFQSFPGRVTLNDTHNKSKHHEQSVTQICAIEIFSLFLYFFKNTPHFSEMKRSIKHLAVIFSCQKVFFLFSSKRIVVSGLTFTL